MSNDKPTAIATIKFYPNKHVEVELSSLKHITPRTLDIASNILLKTYRGMKAKFIAEEHKRGRDEAKKTAEEEIVDAAKFDKKEAKRLDIATKKALKPMPAGKVEPEPKAEEKPTEALKTDETK